MENNIKLIAICALLICIVPVLTSCNWTSSRTDDKLSQVTTPQKDRMHTTFNSSTLPNGDLKDHKGKLDGAVSAAETKAAPSNTSDISSKINSIEDKKSEITEPYNASQTSLIGLKLGDPLSSLFKLWGQANEVIYVNDLEEPYSIYRYSGFSIGGDVSDTVSFITIDSAMIDVRLNGLMVGQKVEDAISILGTPTTNTNFILKYQTHSTILKLDVDPSENVILSIKLFTTQ